MTLQFREQQKEIYADDDEGQHEADPAPAIILSRDTDGYKENDKREQIKYHPRAHLSDFHALIWTVALPLY